MSLTKIFHYRLSKQFVNQITLLCDGKCHCNAAKTVLRQLIVAYLLKGTVFKRTILILTMFKEKKYCRLVEQIFYFPPSLLTKYAH